MLPNQVLCLCLLLICWNLVVLCGGNTVTITSRRMTWFESFNECNLANQEEVASHSSIYQAWAGALYLSSSWMVHKGCYQYKSTGYANISKYLFDNSPLKCSTFCEEFGYFMLQSIWCSCGTFIETLRKVTSTACSEKCPGTKQSSCGSIRGSTVDVYHHASGNYLQTYHGNQINTHRLPEILWLKEETGNEICDKIRPKQNLKCIMVDRTSTERVLFVPTLCNESFPALCTGSQWRGTIRNNCIETTVLSDLSTQFVNHTTIMNKERSQEDSFVVSTVIQTGCAFLLLLFVVMVVIGIVTLRKKMTCGRRVHRKDLQIGMPMENNYIPMRAGQLNSSVDDNPYQIASPL